MSFDLVGDCASDPPLGATARALAETRADDVIYGLGALAVERGHARLALAARGGGARAALAAAIARLGAKVALVDAGEAWPPRLPGARQVAGAEELVQAADRARGRRPRRYLTVAGAVRAPAVLAAEEGATVEELVARAGGACDDDWVAVAGGAPGGRLVERAEAAGGGTLLILPAGHEVARRLRTPIADWLLRAASACEGCRICSDACPAGPALRPHEILWTLATLRDDGAAPAAALACTGCGLCDVMCPARLSPRALVSDLRDRLRAAGAAAPKTDSDMNSDMNVDMNGGGLDRELVTLRLGLGPYMQPLSVDVSR